ncbi:hypothetical protein D9M71_183680 [compost metagenome]
MPATVKRFMRGNIPAGVTETSGATKVILSPTLTPRLAAALSPIRMPNSPDFRLARLPSRKKSPMIETLLSSAGSTALISTFCTTPAWLSRPCNWMKGATCTTFGCSLRICSPRARQSWIGW